MADKGAYRYRDEARKSITINNNNRLSANISIQASVVIIAVHCLAEGMYTAMKTLAC